MKQGTTLFRNGLIVANHPRLPPAFYGWLLVAGDRIEAAGLGEAPEGSFDRVIDASQRAILPGLVNTHAHSHSTLTRGSAEGLPLEAWLGVIEREQSRLTDEQAYAGALATYAEALLSGTTTISDMCLRPAPALRAAGEIGIRATIAPYTAQSKSFAPTLADSEQLLGQQAGPGGRVRVWVGLHDLESCGDEQVRAGVALAKRYGAGLHLHCSETRYSVDQTVQRTGRRPVAQLSELGALGERTLLAHCVWLDEADIHLLSDSGTRVAHCPIANLKLGSGIAPVPEMLEQNVSVTLATDGAKANNNLDMFDVMKCASILHKGARLDPSILPAEKILSMATAAGAESLDIPAGRLEAGRLADLILIRLDQIRLQPAEPEAVLANLVHAAHGTDVDLVMVDGRIVVQGGRLTSLDESEVLRRMQQATTGSH
jgi:5-methylthioadenosine/S-adenosylhomocysteine deaminase